MKYIKLFIFLLVVFASLAGAPLVFGANLYSFTPTISAQRSADIVFVATGSGTLVGSQLYYAWVTGLSTGATIAQWTLRDGSFGTVKDCVSPSQSLNSYGATTGVTGSSIVGLTLISFNFSGTQCSLVSGNTYTLDSNVGGITVTGGDASLPYLILSDSSVVSDLTRIILFTPYTGTTVATGTQSVGFNGYLNFDDWNVEPAYFTFKDWGYRPQAFGFVRDAFSCGTDCIQVEQDLNTFGAFSYSTTTNLQNLGTRNHEACIYYNPVTLFGYSFAYSKVCDSGVYTVSASSTALTNSWLTDFQSAFSSTTATVATACSPLSSSFSMALCLSSMLVPPGDIMVQEVQGFKNIAPWGYAFRFYDIASGNATTSTSTLPVLEYSFGTSSPLYAIGLTSISFDPFGTLSSSTSIVNTLSDQAVPKTAWEILAPIINIIVYLMLGMMIINDLGFIKHKDHHKIK